MDGGGSLMNQSVHTIDLCNGPVKSFSLSQTSSLMILKPKTPQWPSFVLRAEPSGHHRHHAAYRSGQPRSKSTAKNTIYMTDAKIQRWAIRSREKEVEAEMIAACARDAEAPILGIATGHAGQVQDRSTPS